MKQAVFILGFIFNISYLLGVFQLPVNGVSVIYLFVAGLLLIMSRPNDVKIPLDYMLFIGAFMIFYLVSFFFFQKNEYSYYKFFMLFVKIPALTLIPFFLRQNYKIFFWGYISSLMLVILLLTVKSGSFLSSETPTVNSRLDVGSLNPIWISRLVFEAVLIAGMILKLGKGKLLFLILASFPVVYMSGSKGPIVACLITWFLYSLKFGGGRIKMIMLTGIVLIGGYMALTGSAGLNEDSYFVQRFLRVVPDASSDEMKEESRMIVWPLTIEKIKEGGMSALLFGNGIGNFPQFYYGYPTNDRVYPHNFFLEMIVEEGVLLTVFVCFFFFYFYRKSRNDFKYIFIYFLLNAMFSGDIILNEQVFFYLSFTAMNKILFNESTVSNFRELSESGYNSISGYKPV